MTSICNKLLPLFILSALLIAQQATSLGNLFRFLRESDVRGMTDDEVASTLREFQLSEQLGPAALAVARQMGNGPAAVASLDYLAGRSASLPDLGSVSVEPAPSEHELGEIVNKASAYAAGYAHALPNFLCEQTTVFFKRGKAAKINSNWRADHTVVEDVRYHNGTEDYSTKLVNNKPSTAPVSEIRSVYTRGEFGGVLIGAFDPASQAKYKWDHWEMLDAKRVAVVRYQVERVHSGYTVCCVQLGSVTINGVRHQRQRPEITGYRGLFYAEPETGAIHVLTLENTEIPASLSLDESRNLIEYKPVNLDGKQTWLPLRAIHYSRQGALFSRSEISFSGYRSFGAHATIEFPTESNPQ